MKNPNVFVVLHISYNGKTSQVKLIGDYELEKLVPMAEFMADIIDRTASKDLGNQSENPSADGGLSS